MKCTHVCAAKKLISSLYLPDVLFLAYEIAEPHPDMNIKVVAFIVSEKSSNTHLHNEKPKPLYALQSLRVYSLYFIPLSSDTPEFY